MTMEAILKEELELIKVSPKEKSELKSITDAVIESLESKIKKLGINAEVFIGGSLAKDTIIKKLSYDIDLFLRFDKEYSEEQIKTEFKRLFRFFKIKNHKSKTKIIHGSRDYTQVKLKTHKHICIEIIPVLKISRPEQARNVTDLSYFHVNYVKKQLKANPKLIDEILLVKAFCHAQKCYGAESYVSGFSGYALELLIIHYGSFIKFLEDAEQYKGRVIVDHAGHYNSVEELVKTLNKSKIQSPIILIDPTFKERNVSSALSQETFNKFKQSAKQFLKQPIIDFFINKPIDEDELKRIAVEEEAIFGVVEIKTNKQSGDIAGTKLLKFSKFLINEIQKNFDIFKHDFGYDNKKTARVYLILKRKKEIIIVGPSIHYKEAVEGFKKAHPIWYIKEGRIYASKHTDIKFKDFFKNFKKLHRKTIKDMSIRKIKLLK